MALTERNKQIARRVIDEGLRQVDVAREYDMSEQRAGQIVREYCRSLYFMPHEWDAIRHLRTSAIVAKVRKWRSLQTQKTKELQEFGELINRAKGKEKLRLIEMCKN